LYELRRTDVLRLATYTEELKYIVKITIMATEHSLRKDYSLVMLLFSEHPKARCQAVPAIEVAGCFGRHKCVDLRQTIVNTLFFMVVINIQA
jgi:hypothetical protein